MSLKLIVPIALLMTAGAQAAQVQMNYAGGDFYDSPFPDENRRTPGTSKINMRNYAHESQAGGVSTGIVTDALTQVRNQPLFEVGFGTTTGVFFKFDGSIGTPMLPSNVSGPSARLSSPPDLHASVMVDGTGTPTSTVFLINVQPGSPDYLKLYPIVAGYDDQADRGSWGNVRGSGTDHMLALVPLQGVPLLPNTVYAAVVTKFVGAASQPQLLSDLLNYGKCPIGMSLLAPPKWSGGPPSTALDGGDINHGSPAQHDSPCGLFRAAVNTLRTGMGPAFSTMFPGSGYIGNAAFFNSKVVALDVFRTGDPTAGFKSVVADAVGAPRLPALMSPFFLDTDPNDSLPGFETLGIFNDYCLYSSTVTMPVYQNGTPPYHVDQYIGSGRGEGSWIFNAADMPVFTGPDMPSMVSNIKIVVTIPRAPMPPGGFPLVVFERGGGGTEVPLHSRGVVTDSPGLQHPAPGTGPAQNFARAGYAAVEVDNPLGGSRRNGWSFADEDGDIFTIWNLAAMRDNIRQSAFELVMTGYALKAGLLTSQGGMDIHACPTSPGITVNSTNTVTSAVFNTAQLALMGHSVGSTILPLALSYLDPATATPMFARAILSGAGGSYMANALYKQAPRQNVFSGSNNLAFREALEAESALRQAVNSETNAAVNLLQWIGEPADPPTYNLATAPRLVAQQQSVLMIQGVIDHYMEPPIANAVSLSLKLGLGVADSSPAHGFGEDGFAPGGGIDVIYNDSAMSHGPNGAFNGPTFGPYAADSDLRAAAPLFPQLDFEGYGPSNQRAPVLPIAGWSAVVQVANSPALEGPEGTSPTGEDGHEVVFQLAEPKHEYQCFLRSASLGMPVIPNVATYDYSTATPPTTNNCCAHDPAIPGPALQASCDGCVKFVCTTGGHPECCNVANPDPGAWTSSFLDGSTCGTVWTFAWLGGECTP